MDRENNMFVISETSRDGRREPKLLGRLEAELRQVYGDTLNAPLPSRLQALIDRLEDALGSNADARDERSNHR